MGIIVQWMVYVVGYQEHARPGFRFTSEGRLRHKSCSNSCRRCFAVGHIADQRSAPGAPRGRYTAYTRNCNLGSGGPPGSRSGGTRRERTVPRP